MCKTFKWKEKRCYVDEKETSCCIGLFYAEYEFVPGDGQIGLVLWYGWIPLKAWELQVL